jgi:hypothetical protein
MELLPGLFDTEPSDVAVFDPPPSAIPSGFDSIVQISMPLMYQTLVSNLAGWNLNPLSARVPYQAELVSAGLRSLIQPLLKPQLSVLEGPPQLEVQILDPSPQALNWPVPPDGGIGTTGTTTAAAVRAGPGFGRKMVDLAWSIQVNLFWPQREIPPVGSGGTMTAARAAPTITAPTSGRAMAGGISPLYWQVVMPPPPLPPGPRKTIVQGTATMHVPSELVVNAQLYQFRHIINFEGVKPTYTSNDSVMLEFLRTELATSLLAQAIAPLSSQYAVGLSPTIALAGSLTPSQIAQVKLSPLEVDDMVLTDNNGQLVAFCVSLGNDSHGAFSMVTSFLGGQDFAYYASDKVFTPVLKALWRANAILTPIVSDVPVEMPVSPGSDQTGTGRVRVQVALSDTLDDASLIPSTNQSLGDPMQIVTQQTVTLLALWDPQGNPITDLGDLAKPATVPLALSLQLYDKPSGSMSHAIQPSLNALLTKMFMPLFSPVIERYSATEVSGFTSSPLRAIISRWSLGLVATNAIFNPPQPESTATGPAQSHA